MSTKTKNFLTVGAFVLALITCLMAVINVFGIDFKKEVNPDNLIVVGDAYIKDLDTNRGVKIDVKDDGTIKLRGKATSDYNVTVTSLTLKAGTYKFSGLKNPDLNEFYMYVSYGAGQAISGTDSATFTLDAETVVSVVLTWKNGYNFSNFFNVNTVRPELVKVETTAA